LQADVSLPPLPPPVPHLLLPGQGLAGDLWAVMKRLRRLANRMAALLRR
jgi:hypothetical protein